MLGPGISYFQQQQQIKLMLRPGVKCDTSTFIYTNKFNQYPFLELIYWPVSFLWWEMWEINFFFKIALPSHRLKSSHGSFAGRN